MTTVALPALVSKNDILATVQNGIGFITLNRPQALNALSLPMIRDMTALLLAWRDDPAVRGVYVSGATVEGKGAALCAGGDIRFFHQAALAGDPRLEDFFTEEYTLNHLVFTYPKPYIAMMDGIVMGGGMGISQGARLRIATERTKMAMPETNIGLFPDVGGGYFLSRCAGHVGEYLALSGHVLGAGDAIALGLADGYLPASARAAFEAALLQGTFDRDNVPDFARGLLQPAPAGSLLAQRALIDRHFGAHRATAPVGGAPGNATADTRAWGVAAIMASLAADSDPWAAATLAALRKRSPLMMSVTLEQIRRGRTLGIADNLRQERDMVRNSFHLRPGSMSETVEGIRALAVDKDHTPKWNPARIEDVTPEMVEAFFVSPWPKHAHPLRSLA